MNKVITLAHGNGGRENSELISNVFYKYFKNDILAKSEDAAILDFTNKNNLKLATTTDSFTVSPLFFNGGDIGKLAVCGTCNDLAMMGAKPKYLTCSVIIEEGFKTRDLEKIVKSMQKELYSIGAIIVSGDTKVVPKGAVDKIFINTTGIGEVIKSGISSHNLEDGMSILISRDIGAHGATIFSARESIEFSTDLKSDCKLLFEEVEALLDEDINIIALRDATRGGVSAVLNEWAKTSKVCIELNEDSIKVSNEVQGACEMLGFEALNLANEGTFVICVRKEDEEKTLKVLQRFNENAFIAGEVTSNYIDKVVLKSAWGTKRFLDLPTGELLPRIC